MNQILIKYSVLVLLFSALIFKSEAQTLTKGQKPDPLFAKYCLKFHNYYDGLIEFKALLNLEPENEYYRWGIGYCHLHLNEDKSAAIPYFKQVLESKNADLSVWYDLGEAYLSLGQLDNAKEAFSNFLKTNNDDTHLVTAQRMLEMVSNARNLVKNPVDVAITNAGKDINSEFPEFNPFINSGEKLLVFSVQSAHNAGIYRHIDGYFASDIYYSNFKFGEWKKRKRFSSIINSNDIEVGTYLSSNGAYLNVYSEDLLGKVKTYQQFEKRGVSYGFPSVISIVGVDMFYVNSLMINDDGNLLVFSAPSNLTSSENLDLFFCIKGPDGQWNNPKPLTKINSLYGDKNPYFDPSGKYLYFASQGHNSMGGYDLFKCEISYRDSIVLGEVKNLGYPVNSTLDDVNLSLNSTGRYGYISGLRDGGFGDLDIYRVVFNEVDPKFTVIHGMLLNQDSVPLTEVIQGWNNHIDTLNFPINREFKRILQAEKDSIKAYSYLKKNKIPYEKLNAKIEVINLKTNNKMGRFKVDSKSGKFNVILPPGNYQIICSRSKFEAQSYQIEIDDFELRRNKILKNFKLQETP